MNAEITEMLRELATQLGTTTEYVLDVLAKQAMIEGALGVLPILVVAAATLVLVLLIVKKTRVPQSDGVCDWRGEDAVIAWVVLGFIVVADVLFFLRIARHILTAFFNTEYWAISRLMEMLGQL